MRERAAVVAGLVAVLAASAFVAARLEVSAGMAALIPESAERELALVSGRLVDSPLTRTMVLSVGASEPSLAIEAARRWQEMLEGHPEVASLRGGPDPDLRRAVFERYFPRRHQFLSPTPEEELPERLSEAGLQRAARELRAALSLPTAQLVKEVAPADPLLAFPALLRRLEESRRGPLEIVDGRFVEPAGSNAILLLTTRHSAFDAAAQAPFGEYLEQSFAELEDEFGTDLRLERSGVHRFATASEREGRDDMQRISSVSLAGIVLAFLVAFRSVRVLAVSLLPLLAGVLAGACAGILTFDRLHVITLAFGSTLIGVCIDYPIHYASHRFLLPGANPRPVWGAILMGALTTTLGFAVFVGADFPVVRQIGVFSATGILAALVTTRFLLPPLLPAPPPVREDQARVLAFAARGLRSLEAHRTRLVAILLVAAAVAALGLPRTRWQDDLFSLGLLPAEEWLEEDERVRERVSQMDAGRFVVAFGEDDESALRRNDAVFVRLLEARRSGAIEDFRSLHPFLPSASLQERNLARLSAEPDLAARLLAALEAAGFHPEAFEAFERTLEEPAPEPLRFADHRGSPLEPLVDSFRLDLEDGVAILTFLRGVASAERLDALFEDLEHVHYFEQRRFLRTIAGEHRSRALGLVGAGLAAVAALLYARYRRIGVVLAILTPCLVASALTLSLLALAGVPINLLHLLGLLLVLSVGVDYAIFLVASGVDSRTRAVTLLGLCLACLSTCLAFGLLAFSSFPALRALGVATAIGAMLSLVLAPTVLLLLRPGGDSP